MKTVVYDIHRFEQPLFAELNRRFDHELKFLDLRLSEHTAHLASGYPAVSLFTHDRADAGVLRILKEGGTRFLALRSAGFNHVDLAAAASLGLRVMRVPAYSPYAVAEHTVALLLALNRKICRASARVHDLNFSLDGLVGFDLHGKTVGVVGAGRIGGVFARIMRGFGCRVLLLDPMVDSANLGAGAEYVTFEEILSESDIISLHLPLSENSRHLINATAIEKMKKGVVLLNTGRGGLIDTGALIAGLKSGQIGGAGLDVYEEEENVFYRDLSDGVLQDDLLARLLTFPNVLITAHQAFLTHEALKGIVETTLQNLRDFEAGQASANEVRFA